MIFSHIYADNTKDRKTWNNWNSVNSALFPFPEPTAVIVSCWVASKKPVASFHLLCEYPQTICRFGMDCGIKFFISAFLSSVGPPAICGFGMHSGISHICKVFILKFLPEISGNIFPSVFRMSGEHFPIGFQGVKSWKNLFIFLGDTIDKIR